jgi:putative membrane protein
MHHEEDIKLFESASKTLQDSELKAFIDKTLPTLKEHLAAAKGLESGATTSTEPSSATEQK